ncbi:cytochrome p450 [Holotrichia oblita]|uniref:Cytochrome p450 n=1 Tax=Holotrichia oblita TaxID=644536 RepID=A0ACB9SZN7_HOLOL|nr:cytochrome p450 [Holotrichia oblita]
MFTESVFLNIVSAILATVILIIIFLTKRYSYWKDRGVQYIEPVIPHGNAEGLITTKSPSECLVEFYNTMKARKLKYAGIFFMTTPIFVPLDLNLIKQIMQTDFAHFTDRHSFYNDKADPLSAHIFSLTGERWRNLRVKLTPIFTSGKMKLMFPIMVKLAQEFVKTVAEESQNEPLEVKDVCERFTTDVIGNCAFGIDCNSLKDPNTEFRVKGKRITDLTNSEIFVAFLSFTFPSLMKHLGGRLTPKESADFFWNVIKDTTEYREKNGVRRNDALQLLLDMMHKKGEETDNTLSFSEIAAQAFVFFIAGFETSSTLLSFVLFELSLNEHVQNRLRIEVLNRDNDEFTYEDLFEMRYLDMIALLCTETLRKYPPVPILSRVCTKDYKVPDSDVILKENEEVNISVWGIHYDPEYYPDPHKFDPTRFTDENKSKRHQFAFLPFGEGPRICIGLRFGMMQVKVGLTLLITNFKFKLNPQTVLPIRLDPKKFMTEILEDAGPAHPIPPHGVFVMKKEPPLAQWRSPKSVGNWQNIKMSCSIIEKRRIRKVLVQGYRNRLVQIVQYFRESQFCEFEREAKNYKAIVILATFALVIFVFKKRYSHWKDRGIEYIEPIIPYGNSKGSFVKKSLGEWMIEFYSAMKARNVKHAGCYFMITPIYVPIDLDLIKQILQTDFVHFTDHRSFYNDKSDPLSAHIFSLKGQRWRNLRVKLTPTFTSGKMKLMFPIIAKISEELVKIVSDECQKGPMDVKDISGRFTTDVIGNCAFGIDCNSLEKINHYFFSYIETLRKYPPVPVLTRICTKDYKIPNTNIILKEGDEVFISAKGIHYDPEYYPDPEKFDPNRFTDENKNNRHHFAFLPFGEGPRICIGLRFGLMQAKVGLARLITNFKFKLNPRTELPLKLDPKNFLTSILNGLWMDVEKF